LNKEEKESVEEWINYFDKKGYKRIGNLININ
jgi:hypothetical protein